MFGKSQLRLITVLVLFTFLASLIPAVAFADDPAKLILATTTSTADSGLLDNILPDFEKEYNADVEVIAVGTGQAIKLGEDCNADVILVHARAREDKFVEEGHGVNRQDVMYNDFIIVGPESDPAGVKGMTDAAAAFQKIAEAQAPFISRGDDSGTNTKEKAIWAAAGIEPAGDWYIEAGQGMGAVLTMTDEQQGYTLTDRGTYLARTMEGTELVPLVEGDEILFNPYGVIAINPEKCEAANYDLAMKFIEWLTSVGTQQKIGEFKHPSGQPLFIPNSEQWKAAQDSVGEAEDDTGPAAKLLLATTTSTADSGLLDNILPDFENQYNADMEVIAVGTGQAIKLGEDCNADVILVHARAREDKFVDEGHGVNREDVMYNDFIIVGPESDPAGVKGMTDAAAAFQKIAEAAAPFVSRGDDSGTHTKEKGIWAAAGTEPAGDWYIEAGQGMGAVLTMTDEQLGYTLTDRGTYLARTMEGTDLVPLVEGDEMLFNPYGVIAINPEKCEAANYDLAMDFIDWLTSEGTQQNIAEFKHPSGEPLFIPNADEGKADDEELSGKITVFHAGSLTVPVNEMIDQFTAMHPDVSFETEAAGSVNCARKISELERPAEVMMSADYTVIDKLLIPDWADWNIRFAKNDMVIAYTPQSQYADEITADNWYEVLTRDGVIYGHSEPAADPCGYRTLMVWQLAEKYYDEPGLYDKLEASCPPSNVRPKSVELITLLQSGDMDYAFEYRSVAVQHELDFIELPPEINLSDADLADYYAQAQVELPGKEPGETITMTGKAIVYGVTVPSTAERPDLGIAFTKFVIGPDGQAVLESAGQPPIVPAVTADMAAVPEELQSLVVAK